MEKAGSESVDEKIGCGTRGMGPIQIQIEAGTHWVGLALSTAQTDGTPIEKV